MACDNGKGKTLPKKALPVTEWIRVRGARTHNLQGINLDIPRGRITALIGVSGSGKSSLAFHTLYAEGYTRYIESISPYIRQYLDKMEKPPLEEISGLPPSIAVRHRQPGKNPRSTVATSVDLYSYFRILFARGSQFHCPGCGRSLRAWTVDEVVSDLLSSPGEEIRICFDYHGEIPFLINRGYYYAIESGKRRRLDAGSANMDIQVLIDQIRISDENRSRLSEAVERALALGKGRILTESEFRKRVYPTTLRCAHCNVEYPLPDDNLFSFNSPRGACPTCRGFGDIQQPDPVKIFDPERTLASGAVLPIRTEAYHHNMEWLLRAASARGIDIHIPFGSLSPEERDFIMNGDDDFPGMRGFFNAIRSKRYKVQARVMLSRYSSYHTCPSCRGARLNPEAQGYRINGLTIADLTAKTIGEARNLFDAIDSEDFTGRVTPDVFTEIRARLSYLSDSGLDYLTLNRMTFTLSKGEFQRINMAFILGSTLSDSLLILDQPSSDLHPTETRRIVRFLRKLKENGNTVLMIEHNPELVRAADWVVELGPGAGEKGGRVIFSGESHAFFTGNKTLSQKRFRQQNSRKYDSPAMDKFLTFRQLTAHNLKGFDMEIPMGAMTAVCGVSGSGKSSLLRNEIFEKQQVPSGISHVEYVDPGITAAGAGSSVAAFFHVAEPIRKWYAALPASRRLGYTPGHFSTHSPRGRCPGCRGMGGVQVEMQFLPPVTIPCSECGGTGLKPEILKIRIDNLNIADFLSKSVSWAKKRLERHIPRVAATLESLEESGLGYLHLGQSLASISDGERQRLKLARHLNTRQRDTLFLIDDPSYGLHLDDLDRVRQLFTRLTNAGNTIVIADHSRELLSHAAFIIELGPEGGEAGGHLLFQGTLSQFMEKGNTATATWIKKISALTNGKFSI